MANDQNEVKQQAIVSALDGIIDDDARQYTFKMDVLFDGKMRNATFTARYMGVADRLRVGTMRAKLLDGAPADSVDTVTDDIAYMISYLDVSLVKRPSWWDFNHIDDINDLRKLYQKVYDFVERFRVHSRGSADDGAGSAADSEKAVENS